VPIREEAAVLLFGNWWGILSCLLPEEVEELVTVMLERLPWQRPMEQPAPTMEGTQDPVAKGETRGPPVGLAMERERIMPEVETDLSQAEWEVWLELPRRVTADLVEAVGVLEAIKQCMVREAEADILVEPPKRAMTKVEGEAVPLIPVPIRPRPEGLTPGPVG